MYAVKCFTLLMFALTHLKLCKNQVLQFGECAEVETMKFFNLENFLGSWYEIERFPVWYEEYTQCAYKRFQACGRRIEIEYGFVKDGIQFILHVNSSYAPGDDAVFSFEKNNIDSPFQSRAAFSAKVEYEKPEWLSGVEKIKQSMKRKLSFMKVVENLKHPVGIPLSVITTDYINYGVVYGCRNDETLGIKYITAWILSREKNLAPEILETAYQEINSLPFVSTAYLETVQQNEEKCVHHWTAHVQAEDAKKEVNDEL